MRRIVVLGGTGFFGGLIAERLPGAVIASRSRGVDANNAESLRASLRHDDIVVDAAGPFQTRSTALIDAAIAIGFDVIDLSDTPEYSSMIYSREDAIRRAGIRVLTACSALSTVSAIAACVDQPLRLTAYLLPASRYTANPGTIASVLASAIGERRSINFPPPLGRRSGVTVKSVDSATLPRVMPSLRTIEFVVDAGVPGFSMLLRAKRLLARMQPVTLALARRVGRSQGVLAYEVESEAGVKHLTFTGAKSYMMAALPAILAARAIAEERFTPVGLVPPTQHVDGEELFAAARREGIAMTCGLLAR